MAEKGWLERNREGLEFFARLLPAVGGLLFALVLVWRLDISFPSTATTEAQILNFLKIFTALLAFGVAVAILRFAVGFFLADSPKQAATREADSLQGKLAGPIVTLGTLSILGLCIVVVLAIGIAAVNHTPLRDRFDTVVMTVFTAVLPVFATWVGTVLAFVYAKENFEAAAKASRRQSDAETQPISNYVKPLRIKFDAVDMTNFETKLVKAVLAEFKTYSRLPILDAAGVPIAILQRKDLEGFMEGQAADADPTIGQFLATASGRFRAEIARFDSIGVRATLKDGLDKINGETKPIVLFITEGGAKGAKALGIVFDDDRRAAAKP